MNSLPVCSQFTATPDIFTYSLPLRVTATPFNRNLLPNGEIISSSPFSMWRSRAPSGIMNASRFAETDQSDAQRAFSRSLADNISDGRLPSH